MNGNAKKLGCLTQMENVEWKFDDEKGKLIKKVNY